MARIRWEYLRLSYSPTAVPDQSRISRQRWDYHYVVQRSGYPDDKRPMGTDLMDLLAGLGYEGWELVSETSRETILREMYGMTDVGSPITFRWMFKRPIEG